MWVLTVVILIYLFIYVSIIIIIIIIIVLFLFFLGGGHCKRLPGLLGANFHGRCLDFQMVKTLVMDAMVGGKSWDNFYKGVSFSYPQF